MVNSNKQAKLRNASQANVNKYANRAPELSAPGPPLGGDSTQSAIKNSANSGSSTSVRRTVMTVLGDNIKSSANSGSSISARMVGDRPIMTVFKSPAAGGANPKAGRGNNSRPGARSRQDRRKDARKPSFSDVSSVLSSASRNTTFDGETVTDDVAIRSVMPTGFWKIKWDSLDEIVKNFFISAMNEHENHSFSHLIEKVRNANLRRTSTLLSSCISAPTYTVVMYCTTEPSTSEDTNLLRDANVDKRNV
jgi:hypothetical protein